MAKKNNTILIVAALAVGAYFFLRPTPAAAALPVTATAGPDPSQLAYLKSWEQGYDAPTMAATDAAINQMSAQEINTLYYIVTTYFNGNKTIPANDPYYTSFNSLAAKYHLFGR